MADMARELCYVGKVSNLLAIHISEHWAKEYVQWFVIHQDAEGRRLDRSTCRYIYKAILA
jgi:hypothetical protein